MLFANKTKDEFYMPLPTLLPTEWVTGRRLWSRVHLLVRTPVGGCVEHLSVARIRRNDAGMIITASHASDRKAVFRWFRPQDIVGYRVA